MRLGRKTIAALVLAAASLGGCYDGYGYGYGGGVYGGGGYWGDGLYGDGLAGGYGYPGAGYGWYGDYYYPGTGVYVFDRSGRRFRRPRDWHGDGRGWDHGRPGFAGRPGGARPGGGWAGRPDGHRPEGGRPGWNGSWRGRDRGAGFARPDRPAGTPSPSAGGVGSPGAAPSQGLRGGGFRGGGFHGGGGFRGGGGGFRGGGGGSRGGGAPR